MANEITIGMSLTVKNGSLEYAWSPTAMRADQTTKAISGGGQTLNGSTPEAITITDISTAGWTFIRNLDTSATIQLGTGTGTSFAAFASCKPGEAFLGRLATTSITGKVTTTNNVNIQVVVLAE